MSLITSASALGNLDTDLDLRRFRRPWRALRLMVEEKKNNTKITESWFLKDCKEMKKKMLRHKIHHHISSK